MNFHLLNVLFCSNGLIGLLGVEQPRVSFPELAGQKEMRETPCPTKQQNVGSEIPKRQEQDSPLFSPFKGRLEDKKCQRMEIQHLSFHILGLLSL